jgi:PAS domain S-box-containing protein
VSEPETLPHDSSLDVFALETGRMGTFEWLIPDGLVRWSPSLERMHGYPPGGFAGTADAYFAEIHPDDRERVGTHVQAVLEGRREHHIEYRIVRPDGTALWVEGRGNLQRDAAGRPLRLIGVCTDINDRKLAEAALRESELRYRALVEATAQVIWTGDGRGVNAPSPSWERFTGQRWPEYAGLGAGEAVHPDDRKAVSQAWQHAIAGELPFSSNYRLRRADGAYRRVWSRGIPVRRPDGRVQEWVGVITDDEDRLQAEDAIRCLADASAALGSSLDYETALRTVARLTVPALADWCAIDLAEPDSTLRRIAISHVDPTMESRVWELQRRFPPRVEDPQGIYDVFRTGRSMLVPSITPEMYAAGAPDPEFVGLVRQLGPVSYVGVPVAAHGAVFGVLSLVMSASGRHYGEAELKVAKELGRRAGVAVDNARRHHSAVESLNMLDAMLAASPVGHAFVDRELRFVRVNPALAALHRRPIHQHLGRTIGEVLPPWAPYVEPLCREVLETGHPVLERTISVPAPGGEDSYELLVTCFPVRDATGEIQWIGVTKADITERRRAEEHVREAQRLEAVGQLAGGVAHEINNALQGVLGFGDFALRALPPGHAARLDVEQMRAAGARAANITQQLLAFSRRQALQMVDVDLGRLVADFAPVLRQALGAASPLGLDLPSEPLGVRGDRGQLQQILLNLCFNSRDALPDGGQVTIAVRRLEAAPGVPDSEAGGDPLVGPVVALEVTDTGVGMAPKIQTRLFEPFFTTKEVGQGTGLGLAVVYGIVRQHGGRIAVRSAPGAGTTVTVYLPGHAPVESVPPPRAADVSIGSSGHVLVIDDELMVREYVRRLLEESGYHVREATDVRSAIAVLAEPGPAPDVVLSDVGLPGAGGGALADWLREEHPDLPVVYMSGYSSEEASRRGLLPAGTPVLQKPFSAEALLGCLNAVSGER